MDRKEGHRQEGQAQACAVAKEVNPWYDMVNVPPVNQNCKSLGGCKMEHYESTGIDPYEDDTDEDELPTWLYAVLIAVLAICGLIAAPFAWLRR